MSELSLCSTAVYYRTPATTFHPQRTFGLFARLSNLANRELLQMRWGLIPSWTKDPKKAPLNNNARAETVADKPSFKSAYKSRRCIIPVTGFYEWKTEGKT